MTVDERRLSYFNHSSENCSDFRGILDICWIISRKMSLLRQKMAQICTCKKICFGAKIQTSLNKNIVKMRFFTQTHGVWKSQEKVSFNIASEASYVYKSSLKMPKTFNFCSIKSDLSGSTVWPQVSLDLLNATFWTIFKHCEVSTTRLDNCRLFVLHSKAELCNEFQQKMPFILQIK